MDVDGLNLLESALRAASDPLARAAGFARIARFVTGRSDLANAARQDAGGKAPESIRVDLACALAAQGDPGAGAALEQVLSLNPRSDAYGSLAEATRAMPERSPALRASLEGKKGRQGIVYMAAALPGLSAADRAWARDALRQFESFADDRQVSALYLRLACALCERGDPLVRRALETFVRTPPDTGAGGLETALVSAGLATTPSHARWVIDGIDSGIDRKLKALLSPRTFPALSLIACGVDAGADELSEHLRPLLDAAWRLKDENLRRNAVCQTVAAAGRIGATRTMMPNLLDRLGTPQVGPYFRTQALAAIGRALARDPHAENARLAETAAEIVWATVRGAEGDVSFVFDGAVALLDALHEHDRSAAARLARRILDEVESNRPRYWTLFYAARASLAAGIELHPDRENAISWALEQAVNGLDAADLVRDAAHRIPSLSEAPARLRLWKSLVDRALALNDPTARLLSITDLVDAACGRT